MIAMTAGLLSSAKLINSPSARAGLADSMENPRRGAQRARAAVIATGATVKPSSIRRAARAGRARVKESRREMRETRVKQPYVGEGLSAFEDVLTGRFKNAYRRALPPGVAGYRDPKGKRGTAKRPRTKQPADGTSRASWEAAAGQSPGKAHRPRKRVKKDS
jgi:hypothetical protein